MKIFRLAVITLIASSLAGPAFGKNDHANSGNKDNSDKNTPKANSNAYNGKGKKAPEVTTFANDLVAETHADDPGSPLDIVLRVLGTYRSDDTEGLDGLIDALGDDSSDVFESAHEAMINSTGHDPCGGPKGYCKAKSKGKAIKQVEKKLLDEFAAAEAAEEEPDVEGILERLEAETGVHRAALESLLDEDPASRDRVKNGYKTAVEKKRKKDTDEISARVEKVLNEAADKDKDMEAAVHENGLSEDEVVSALELLPQQRQEALLANFERGPKNLKEKVEKVYKEKGFNKRDDDTWEPTGQGYGKGKGKFVQDEDGTLRFLRGDSSETISEEETAFDQRSEERQRRKLEVRSYLAEADDFGDHLTDHLDDLQRLLRELTLSCASGSTNIECVSNNFDDMASELTSVGSQVDTAIAPVQSTLSELENSISLIDTVERASTTIFDAVSIAAKIPGAIGSLFKPLKYGIQPIKEVLTRVDDGAGKFQATAGNAWKNSIGRVTDLIGTFDEDLVTAISGVGGVALALQESQCMPSLLEDLSGVDVFGAADTAVGYLLNYVQTLTDALQFLLAALSNQVWKTIQTGLKAIVDGIDEADIFLKPFAVLGSLLEKEIKLPWFVSPYSMKKLGDSRCKSGYHKPFLSLTKCWESNSRQWESVPLTIPAKMKKKCSYKGYSENVFGDCNNKKQKAHMANLDAGCKLSCSKPYCKRKGWRIKCYAPKCNLSCWSRCPWNHYVPWWSPWRCVERCPSTRHADFDNCFDKSCNSGYSRTWNYLYCIGSKRNQNSHGALCNYSVKAGTKARRDWLTGMCWQTCTSGETEILGQCFPKAELRISIQDIFDALEEIMSFIQGLPLVGAILDAIDTIVEVVLDPVTSKISDFLSKALNLPDFPNFSIGALPFSAFDAIDLPELPDMDAIFNAPKIAFDKMLSSTPLAGYASCAANMTCLFESTGVSSIIDDVVDIFDGLTDIDIMFESFVNSVTCSRWGNKTLSISEAFTNVGLDIYPGAGCEIEVPFCEEFDLEAMQASVVGMTAFFESVSTKLVGRRNLASLIDMTETKFYPIIGVGAMAPSPVGDRNALSKKWKISIRGLGLPGKVTGGKPNQPVGWHFRLEPKVYLDWGLMVKDGTFHPSSFQVGTKFKAKFGITRGAKDLLNDVIQMARAWTPDHSDSDTPWVVAAECFAITRRLRSRELTADPVYSPSGVASTKACAKAVAAASLALGKIIVGGSLLLNIDTDFSEKMTELKTPPSGCALTEMMTRVSTFDEGDPSEVKYATGCIQYWFKRAKAVDKYMEKYVVSKEKQTFWEKGLIKMRKSIRIKTSLFTKGNAVVNGPQVGFGYVGRDDKTKSEFGINFFMDAMTGQLTEWNVGQIQLYQLYQFIKNLGPDKWKTDLQSGWSDVAVYVQIMFKWNWVFSCDGSGGCSLVSEA